METNTMVQDALRRTLTFAEGANKITDGGILPIAELVQPLEHGSEICGEELYAIATLLTRIQGRLIEQAQNEAHRLGWLVGKYEITPIARESNEPVVFITGNSHMPPLRAFGISDEIWSANDRDMDLWSSYVEGVEKALDGEQVYLDCPDYDNALYVVDLRRFQHVGDDGDTLQDEWEPVA